MGLEWFLSPWILSANITFWAAGQSVYVWLKCDTGNIHGRNIDRLLWLFSTPRVIDLFLAATNYRNCQLCFATVGDLSTFWALVRLFSSVFRASGDEAFAVAKYGAVCLCLYIVTATWCHTRLPARSLVVCARSAACWSLLCRCPSSCPTSVASIIKANAPTNARLNRYHISTTTGRQLSALYWPRTEVGCIYSYFTPSTGAKYSNQHVCMSVCFYVCSSIL